MRRFAIAISALLLFAGCGRDGESSGESARGSAVRIGGGYVTDAGEFDAFVPDIRTALPRFASFGKKTGRNVDLLDGKGGLIGRLYLAPAGKYPRTEGFNGYVEVAVILTPDDRIAGVAVGRNGETPRWLERVRKAGFLTRWNGRTVGAAAELEIDAVTRATYSSTAIRDEVRAILCR